MIIDVLGSYCSYSAGIGFGPNGLRAMDLIEPAFRPKYEQICVGNKGADAQHIFFEGLLLEEGLGMISFSYCIMRDRSSLTLGRDQPWYGTSAWGHPDFDRKSVCNSSAAVMSCD